MFARVLVVPTQIICNSQMRRNHERCEGAVVEVGKEKKDEKVKIVWCYWRDRNMTVPLYPDYLETFEEIGG